MNPQKSTQSKRAFTLIELLTVIAVIGVLVGILIPAIGSVRKNADATKTASNLRQIGVGINLYANEHNGQFPSEYDSERNRFRLVLSGKTIPGLKGATNWREAVHRYLTDNFKPSSGYNFALGADKDIWVAGNTGEGSNHFGVNVFMGYYEKFRLNQIKNPAKYVMIGEINSPAHFIDPREKPDTTGQLTSKNRMSHPGDTAFYLFVDGHVEQLEGQRHPSDYPEMWYD